MFSPPQSQDTGAGVHMYMMFVPFSVTPTCCLFWLRRQPMWGVRYPAAPSRSWGLGDWSEKHVMVRVKWGPRGNRRLTRAASCLSCFVKAANLPFVAADSSDKQERKWRIFHDGNKIRSGGGGRAFPWGMGSSQEDLCILHVKPPREPGSTLICRPTFVVVLEVRFLSFTSSPASVFQGALMKINWRCTIASFRHMTLTTALQWMQECKSTKREYSPFSFFPELNVFWDITNRHTSINIHQHQYTWWHLVSQY